MSELPTKLRRTLAFIAGLQVEAGWAPARIPTARATAALGCSASSWRRRIRQLVAGGWIERQAGPGRGCASRYAVRWERRRPWFDLAGGMVPGSVRPAAAVPPIPPAPRDGIPQGLRDYLLSWRVRDPRYYAQLLALYQAG